MFILKYRLHNIVFIQWLFTLGGKINARECLCFQGDFRTSLILTAVQLEADGCQITCNLELFHIISRRLAVVICCSSDFFSWAKAKREKKSSVIISRHKCILMFVSFCLTFVFRECHVFFGPRILNTKIRSIKH